MDKAAAGMSNMCHFYIGSILTAQALYSGVPAIGSLCSEVRIFESAFL